MSRIWGYIIVIFGIYGMCTGRVENITNAILEIPKSAFDVCITLVVTSSFYLGITKILQECKVIHWISGKLLCVYKLLFPGLEDEETLEYISMNLTSNMLGLGMASTSVGIKVMKRLKELNGNKTIASNYMITFMVLNITMISIFPMSIVAIRQSVGSSTPLDFIVVEICASFITMITTLVIERLFRCNGD